MWALTANDLEGTGHSVLPLIEAVSTLNVRVLTANQLMTRFATSRGYEIVGVHRKCVRARGSRPTHSPGRKADRESCDINGAVITGDARGSDPDSRWLDEPCDRLTNARQGLAR